MLQMARKASLVFTGSFLKTLPQIYVHWDGVQPSVSSSTHMLLSDVTTLPPASPPSDSHHLCSDLTFQPCSVETFHFSNCPGSVKATCLTFSVSKGDGETRARV